MHWFLIRMHIQPGRDTYPHIYTTNVNLRKETGTLQHNSNTSIILHETPPIYTHKHHLLYHIGINRIEHLSIRCMSQKESITYYQDWALWHDQGVRIGLAEDSWTRSTSWTAPRWSTPRTSSCFAIARSPIDTRRECTSSLMRNPLDHRPSFHHRTHTSRSDMLHPLSTSITCSPCQWTIINK